MTATTTKEEELHWIALTLVPGLGTKRAWHIVERYRSPLAIFRASRSELEAQGLPGSVAQSIASGCTFDDAVDQQQKMLNCGARLVPVFDPMYPPRLREIYDPPVVLFARGRLELLQSVMLGVVGTRRPTPYGIAATERLSPDLAQAGLTLVSGMARGIDTAAHKSTLAVGGDTVAVFGCGVDQVYPTENKKLANEMAEKGLLLSEFAMGTPGYPQNFPVRNRIISGMSVGVLIIEGAQFSGSGITAKMAIDQQREVFAVPGSIMSKMSWGPNLLIKQGAKLVQEWNDVLVELPTEIRRQLIVKAQSRQGLLGLEDSTNVSPAPGQEYSPAAKALLPKILPDVPVHLDALIETFEHLSSSEIIAALFELEMMGLIRQLPGRNFVKVW
ncbi:MAG: DNA-protecting protein DprA [Acidobacteriaceae bacterium]|nr:DNA-protecting protein DprA [Acidobacteriaceae bacterium]